MVGHPYEGCPRVARFVRGHIYEMRLLRDLLLMFVQKGKHYHFRLIASGYVGDKIHKRERCIFREDSIPHFHIKEVDQDQLPLYINWVYRTKLYNNLVSGQRKLRGTKCPSRLKKLKVVTST